MSTVYAVAGMNCGGCVKSITKHIDQVAGTESVEVDLAAGTVTVQGASDDEAVRAAIAEAGYKVLPTTGP